MDRKPLGTVSAPSGALVIFDMGYASVWENGVEAAQVFSDHGPVDVPESIDYAIVGSDAAEAAVRFDRQPGVWLYDIPLEGAERYAAVFAESAQGLDARLEQEPSRVGLLERAERAAVAGAGAFWMGGLEAVVVGGLDGEREYELFIDYAEWGPEVGYRPNVVTIEIDAAFEVAASNELGVVMVDWARLMVVDPTVMSLWRHEKASDGLCDVAFWGRDAAEAAGAVGAQSLTDDVYGWPNLPLESLPPEVERLQAWRVENPEKIIRTDVRPHSHHWEILTQAAQGEGGTITLGDALVTGFFSNWGDGAFPVFADRAADGSLVAVRIILGDAERADRMRQVAARHRATLHHHQPIDTNFDSHIDVLLPGADEDRWEGLPARRVHDGYEITCAPLMAYGLSYGDVVDWRSATDWTVVRRSGHRTIRIGTEDKAAFDRNRHTLGNSLQQLRHEWLGEYYVAIDVPPGAAVTSLEQFAEAVPGTAFEYADKPPDWVGKG